MNNRLYYNNNLTSEEREIIHKVQHETDKLNLDNISRTKAYFNFYERYPDMIWAFLASMVSRNGGYNMCDLEGEWFPKIIKPQMRWQLFLTYERANWLIFKDAYSQLLLYHYSTKMNTPLFHLLPFFQVSEFMKSEWEVYWKHREKRRLMIALITNEQNVIHKPVILHPIYKRRVFQSWMFLFQDWFHFSFVLFPMCDGRVFGASVNGFRDVNKRINLGKRLADILFDNQLYPYFYQFSKKVEHTGSRYDYEKYLKPGMKRQTPYLRSTFPVIRHHLQDHRDWFRERKFNREWMNPVVQHIHPIELSNWYWEKLNQMHGFISFANWAR